MKMDEPEPAAAATAAATATPAKPKRKAEPTSDRLSNLSRVTPAQLPYIAFAPDARWVPVRPVNAGVVAPSEGATLVGAGGGILMMRDREPEKPVEIIEMEVQKVLTLEGVEGVEAEAAALGVAGEAELLTGPIADPPAPFEYSNWD